MPRPTDIKKLKEQLSKGEFVRERLAEILAQKAGIESEITRCDGIIDNKAKGKDARGAAMAYRAALQRALLLHEEYVELLSGLLAKMSIDFPVN